MENSFKKTFNSKALMNEEAIERLMSYKYYINGVKDDLRKQFNDTQIKRKKIKHSHALTQTQDLDKIEIPIDLQLILSEKKDDNTNNMFQNSKLKSKEIIINEKDEKKQILENKFKFIEISNKNSKSNLLKLEAPFFKKKRMSLDDRIEIKSPSTSLLLNKFPRNNFLISPQKKKIEETHSAKVKHGSIFNKKSIIFKKEIELKDVKFIFFELIKLFYIRFIKKILKK